jgi:ADP-ribose pyrophosphatase YjhB (NUDIX family)
MSEKKFVLCVDGILINDGKILLLKRNVEPFKGYWHVIGGHVEENETLKHALKREYKEETSLDIKVGGIIGFRIENTQDRTKIIVILEVLEAKGQIILNHENIELGWFDETPPKSVSNYNSFLKKK